MLLRHIRWLDLIVVLVGMEGPIVTCTARIAFAAGGTAATAIAATTDDPIE